MGSRAPVSCKSEVRPARPAQPLHPRPPPNVCTSIKAAGRTLSSRRRSGEVGGAGRRSSPRPARLRGVAGPPTTLPNSLLALQAHPDPAGVHGLRPRARAARTAPRTGAPRAAPASCRPRSSEDAALPGTVSGPDTPLARRHFRWLHGHPRPRTSPPGTPGPVALTSEGEAPRSGCARGSGPRPEKRNRRKSTKRPRREAFRSPYKTQDFADAFCACMAWDPAVFLASVVWALFLQKVRGGGSGCPGPAGFGARLLTPRGRSAGPGGERPVYCLLVKTLREEREGKVTMSRK